MAAYAAFEKEFKEALARFPDAEYQPPAALCEVLGCLPEEGKVAVRSAISRGIEHLKPPEETPKSAYASMIYALLWSRFQLRLTQEETAYRLNVSRRTVNRLQHSAAEALAATVWEQSRRAAKGSGDAEAGASPIQATDWNTQLQRELSSLEAKAPSATANVGEVIEDVLEIAAPILDKQGVAVKVMAVQPNLAAAVHPVLLHQILLSTITHLALSVVEGEISLYAKLEDGSARIALAGNAAHARPALANFAADLPTANKIGVDTLLEGRRVFVRIAAPAVNKVTVLVVDDNDDMARFYQDCAIGTRYHIVHVAQGQSLPAAVKSLGPDVIVLDIMLPDVDGWRLLMRLHEDPATRHIPVIICTVIREEELARSLGAACYLSKPVRPAEFIGALDRLCPPAAGENSTAPANSAGVASATAPLP